MCDALGEEAKVFYNVIVKAVTVAVANQVLVAREVAEV